jgi:arylsulfatase
VKDGKPMYTYNFLGLQEYTVAGNEALPAGKPRSVSSLSMTVAGTAKAAWVRFLSTGKR